MRIAIDADQVLFDFLSTWHTFAENTLKRELVERNQSYHLIARYGLSMAEFVRCCTMFDLRDAWKDCPVIPEALEAVQAWLEADHEVFVISAVSVKARKSRQKVLDKLGLRQVRLMGVGFGGSKFDPLRILKPEIFADDLWAHCREAVDAGVPRVARIRGNHDGGGGPVPGVPVLENIGELVIEQQNDHIG
ncbi:hypothetical protein [Acidithiobacillus sulfurivorans]|uniref:HAD family hydrolase n=1 Tax=Acidithiobacillus sulfurivorans TaxID=1958756 RepID=A0ABS5ZZ42_9PROT|nr:hypothetical protein [Acidithiobacillus sulfurivorans]MBU2760280.1 hypothetical protein [Acidithiobacillus sulfurivorans]